MHATFIELSSFQKYRADYLNDEQRDALAEALNVVKKGLRHD